MGAEVLLLSTSKWRNVRPALRLVVRNEAPHGLRHTVDRGIIGRMRVLVVDGANVVGSVPDGWWRDRAGAAARLHEQLIAQVAAGELASDDVVLVLEGQARRGVPVGADRGVTTVHAPGEGDDEIVAQPRARSEAGADVAVATADRGLIARLPEGVETVGPRTVRGASKGRGRP